MTLAKPNYSFEKRQKELAKTRKKEAKQQKKMGAGQPVPAAEPAADTPPKLP
jgi:hypothetical protein